MLQRKGDNETDKAKIQGEQSVPCPEPPGGVEGLDWPSKGVQKEVSKRKERRGSRKGSEAGRWTHTGLPLQWQTPPNQAHSPSNCPLPHIGSCKSRFGKDEMEEQDLLWSLCAQSMQFPLFLSRQGTHCVHLGPVAQAS